MIFKKYINKKIDELSDKIIHKLKYNSEHEKKRSIENEGQNIEYDKNISLNLKTFIVSSLKKNEQFANLVVTKREEDDEICIYMVYNPDKNTQPSSPPFKNQVSCDVETNIILSNKGVKIQMGYGDHNRFMYNDPNIYMEIKDTILELYNKIQINKFKEVCTTLFRTTNMNRDITLNSILTKKGV